jgi:ketosteroid isomerase-like protein
MAEHPNATFIRNALASMDAGDISGIAEAVADDVVWHEIGNPEPVRGRAAMAARFGGGEVDFTITASTHDVLANDEHAIALVNATGTRGGRTLEYRTAEIFHVRGGKIVERWAFSDDTAAISAFFA